MYITRIGTNALLELGSLVFETKEWRFTPCSFHNNCLIFITALIVSQTTL